MTSDNNLLGQFELTGIPPAPRGVPQIDVTFDVDGNGIINVSAVDKSTNKMEKITIRNDKSRLSDAEIKRMVDESDKFKSEDEAQRERIQAKNSLESYACQVKCTVEDDRVKDKITEEDKKKVLDKVKEAVTWLCSIQTATKEEFEFHQKDLEKECQPVMIKLALHVGEGILSSSLII